MTLNEKIKILQLIGLLNSMIVTGEQHSHSSEQMIDDVKAILDNETLYNSDLSEELLKRASNEIRMLRNQNELMSARLDMFDQLMILFNTNPACPKGMGMSEDLAWQIDGFLKK